MSNLASREYSEKRGYIRMQIDTPVTLQLPNNEEITGICKDLSGGGMLVELEKVVPVGTDLTITIEPTHNCTPMLRADTYVSRVEGGPNDTCTIGLEIREMLPI